MSSYCLELKETRVDVSLPYLKKKKKKKEARSKASLIAEFTIFNQSKHKCSPGGSFLKRYKTNVCDARNIS